MSNLQSDDTPAGESDMVGQEETELGITDSSYSGDELEAMPVDDSAFNAIKRSPGGVGIDKK